jgi:integrase/recombinase XerD
MRKLKHLPLEQWPADDQKAFERAYEPGDIFDESRGPGAHHSSGWRRMITTSYRRWLGFVSEEYSADLLKPPTERITPERVRAFVEHIEAEVRSTTVAMSVAHLYAAARLIAPELDWRWLASIRRRLATRAKPEDRYNRLVPGWHTLDFGIELMEEAKRLPSNKMADRQYRDGLMLVLLSLWIIRRRSFAALTVSRHIEFDHAGMSILLYPEDTKSRRAESFRVPEAIVPYFTHYLNAIRPRLVGRRHHDGLWASNKGAPLTACRIYDIVHSRTMAKFGKAMGLHDFRRAAHTFLAIDAPTQIGLIPGVLQHVSLDTGDRHYNLARSIEASRRFASHLAKKRAKLRPVQARRES